MSLWSRIFGAGGGGRDPGDDFWYQPLSRSTAGQMVTHDSALRASVVFACVRCIAEAVSSLPLVMYERTGDDKQRAQRHPLFELLHDAPNEEQTAIEWREQMQAWCSLRGTAVSEIVPGARGPVSQLVPLHPDHIKWVRATDSRGRSQWQVVLSEPGTPTRRLLRSEVFVLRALMVDAGAPVGLDPICVEANAIGATLAATDYASRFFENDARPAGIIEHPGHFKDEESRGNFVKAWQRAFGGANRHRTGVLEHGMKYQQLGLTNEQAQFLETRKYQDVDIARIFRVPPHKVGILDRATFSNIEQQAIEFVTDTLRPWLVRWEQAISRDLILNRGRFFAEHNVNGLLRGDTEARFRAYAIGRNWGWLSANDVRRLENLNAIDEGDIYLQPQNMAAAGQMETDVGNGAQPGPNGQELNRMMESKLWTPQH